MTTNVAKMIYPVRPPVAQRPATIGYTKMNI